MLGWILLEPRCHFLNPHEIPCYSPALQFCCYSFYFTLGSYSPAPRTDHIISCYHRNTLFLIWHQEFLFFQALTWHICIFRGQLFLVFLSTFHVLLFSLLSLSSYPPSSFAPLLPAPFVSFLYFFPFQFAFFHLPLFPLSVK